MKLSIEELNELIYCIGITKEHGKLINMEVANKLEMKLRDEFEKALKEYDNE